MANKSNPTGIRFDLDKIEFIKQREKLTTNQQVVDFLMNKYWWGNRMPIPTHKEVPPIYLKQDSQLNLDEQPKLFKTKFEFLKSKRECESEEDYLDLLKELDLSNLPEKEKREIRTT